MNTQVPVRCAAPCHCLRGHSRANLLKGVLCIVDVATMKRDGKVVLLVFAQEKNTVELQDSKAAMSLKTL